VQGKVYCNAVKTFEMLCDFPPHDRAIYSVEYCLLKLRSNKRELELRSLLGRLINV
jgi:hypothetical protein